MKSPSNVNTVIGVVIVQGGLPEAVISLRCHGESLPVISRRQSNGGLPGTLLARSSLVLAQTDRQVALLKVPSQDPTHISSFKQA